MWPKAVAIKQVLTLLVESAGVPPIIVSVVSGVIAFCGAESLVIGIAMPLSQDMVQDSSARPQSCAREAFASSQPLDNPWRDAAVMLISKIRDHLLKILLSALVCAGLAGTAKFLLPAKYKASAQLLIDPQIESRWARTGGESQSSTLDANAAVNYVESQMGVINSERVLLNVIRDQGLASPPSAADGGNGLGEGDIAESRRARELLENRALLKLQKALKIFRAERSFLVTVEVADPNPETAANLANALVKAYGEVNTIDRTAGVRRESMDLANRIEDMRRALNEAEAQLQTYKIQRNLVGINDKSIIERRVSDATDGLSAAEKTDIQARARLKQLEAAPNDIGAVSAFGADPESRQLQVLIVGRAAIAAELEQLESTLGDQHPALIAARMRLRDYNQRINNSLEGLRRTVRAQIAEAQMQIVAAQKRLAVAASDMAKTKEADAPLRQLEDAVDAKRKSLTELELRQRQAGDGSRVESGGGGFRVVSPARAPSGEGKLFSIALWSIFGGLIGVALSVACISLGIVFESEASSDVPNPGAVNFGRWPADSEIPSDKVLPEHSAIASLPEILPQNGRRLLSADEAQSEVVRRPRSPYSCEVAKIYERLCGSRNSTDHIVVLVAGAEPQSGASTLAVNLARTAAARGRNVLLIDAHRTHPALNLAISPQAPKTLIKLAGRWRPLFRLQPYTQNLSLIPALDDEKNVCRDIADEMDYRPVEGINGNFDFVVFDGPDADQPDDLTELFSAVNKILLVGSDDACNDARSARLLRGLSELDEKFAGYVRRVSKNFSEAA